MPLHGLVERATRAPDAAFGFFRSVPRAAGVREYIDLVIHTRLHRIGFDGRFNDGLFRGVEFARQKPDLLNHSLVHPRRKDFVHIKQPHDYLRLHSYV